MLTVAEARDLIFRDATPGTVESATLLRALGKVLAAPIDCPLSHPPFDNAAVDGFAVRAEDLSEAKSSRLVSLPIAMEVLPGCDRIRILEPGTACRILAGAPMPVGADAVVKVEDVQEGEGTVTFRQAIAKGENLRRTGEDLRLGDRLLEAGTPLTPPRIALLAGIGMAEVPVYAAPRVAILVKGDELVPPGHLLRRGQIYDSNAYALAAMVSEAGGIPILLGALRDDPELTFRQLREAVSHDVVLVSGGHWQGRSDPLGDCLRRNGTLHFERVAQQPGQPFRYASLWGTPLFAFPGNPVSTMVCFEVYIRPVLRRLSGQREVERPRLWVTLGEPVAKQPGSQMFLRALVESTQNGPTARLLGSPGASLLGSLAQANALLIVPAEAGGLEAGQQVEALSLQSLN